MFDEPPHGVVHNGLWFLSILMSSTIFQVLTLLFFSPPHLPRNLLLVVCCPLWLFFLWPFLSITTWWVSAHFFLIPLHFSSDYAKLQKVGIWPFFKNWTQPPICWTQKGEGSWHSSILSCLSTYSDLIYKIQSIVCVQSKATPLWYAAYAGQLAVVEWLITNRTGVDIDAADDDVGHIFFSFANDAFNSLLLPRFIYLCWLPQDGWTPLFASLGVHHYDTSRFLIAKGADVTVAAWVRLFSFLSFFLSLLFFMMRADRWGSELKSDGWTCLLRNSPPEIMRLLIENGANLNAVNMVSFSIRYSSKSSHIISSLSHSVRPDRARLPCRTRWVWILRDSTSKWSKPREDDGGLLRFFQASLQVSHRETWIQSF